MKDVKLAMFAMEALTNGIAMDLTFSDAFQNLSEETRREVLHAMGEMLQAVDIEFDEVDDDVLQASSDTADLFKRVQGKLQ